MRVALAPTLVALACTCGAPGGGTTSDGGSEATASETSTVGASEAGTATTAGTDATTAGTDATTAGPPVEPGEFSLLTYNVAGLPQGISSSNPEEYIPQISPLLDAYDLVLAQEDFYYHAELAADAHHPHQSTPYMDPPDIADLGDGLNRFSQFPFDDPVERVPWYDCHGNLDCASDCLATKGWSFSRHVVAAGVEVDVYNLHMEAGGCPEDEIIRAEASAMLVDQIATRSGDRAVIVAGDFNMRFGDPADAPNLAALLDGLGLVDACQALACSDDRIDKILARGAPHFSLVVSEWWVPGEFVDPNGEDLSDHLPVAARLAYAPIGP